MLVVLATGAALDAQAQVDSDGRADVRFGSEIEGLATTSGGLLEVLEAHTRMEAVTDKEARVLVVYGVAKGDKVYDAVASSPLRIAPGKTGFISSDEVPLLSPWKAFDIPLAGFDGPLEGFENPIISFGAPTAAFDVPLAGFDDPALGLEAAWRAGRSRVEEGAYGLVLFTMPDPSMGTDRTAVIAHRAVVVPFRAGDTVKLKGR